MAARIWSGITQTQLNLPVHCYGSLMENLPTSAFCAEGSKSSINSRFGGPKKPANSTSSEKPDSAASASFKGKGQSDKLKVGFLSNLEIGLHRRRTCLRAKCSC